MSYFDNHYSDIHFAKSEEGGPGLRRAQIGAAHAVASHFALRRDPALVTMPTGSGKTLVAMMSPFLLSSRRVLVITPSRLV